MEPSEPSPSPTVFDMPPRETEELAAPEIDTLKDNPDLSPEAPEGNSMTTGSEEPWFMRYQNTAPKQDIATSPEEEPPAEAQSSLDDPDTAPQKFRYSPILTEETVSAQAVSDSLWHPPPPPEAYPLPGVPPSSSVPETPPAMESPGKPESQIEPEANQEQPPAPVASVTSPTASAVTSSVPTTPSPPSHSSHVPLKPAIGSVSAPGESSKPASTQELRRGATREDLEKASQLGLGPRESNSGAASARPANFRRSSHLGKLLALTFLANLAALGGACWWLQKEYMDRPPVFVTSPRTAPAPTPAPVVEPPKPAAPTTPGVSQEEMKKLETSLKSAADQSSAQVADALKRLADSEQQNQRLVARVNELSATLTTLQSALDEVKNKPAPREPAPASIRLPDAEELTPAQGELVLLKERNRLTAYADEAIATASREPYQRLWDTLEDPRLADLVHAARAEILRVQNFYLSGSRIDRFDIPVATYFPEEGVLRDTQLKDDQLIKLLHNLKNPWEVRLKAANILGMRRSMTVGDALVKAINQEDNLDVMKEATFSFEQMTGYHAKLFDAASIAKWWKEYKATPPPPAPKPPKSPATTAPNDPKAKATSKKGDAPEEKPASKTGKGSNP